MIGSSPQIDNPVEMNLMETAKPQSKVLAWFLSATPEQARDTGMAMVLICLLWAYWGARPGAVPLAIGLLLLTMVWPKAFKPLAVLWFGLSHLLGAVVSRIILTLLFFLLVTPVGLVRRWVGADSLQLKKWKKDRGSVFVVREGTILPKDLENPY
jgi:hypothetical protein